MLSIPRSTAALAAVVVATTALAALRTSAPARFDSVERIEASLGEAVAFGAAPDGNPELGLEAPPASDGVGRVAAALVAAPRIVLRDDGAYVLRVAPLPVPANDLLAPGLRLAESAISELNRRVAERARAVASRFAVLEDGRGLVFVDSRSRRIPVAAASLPDLRRPNAFAALNETLRRTIERLGPPAAPPAPGGSAAEGGGADARADAVARAARERERAWADAAPAAASRAELVAFADRVAVFSGEVAPGGPATRRVLVVAARDALARFVQHADARSVTGLGGAAAILLWGTLGGAMAAAARRDVRRGIARPLAGGALLAGFGVAVLLGRGIVGGGAPLFGVPYAAALAALAFGLVGGFVLDGGLAFRRDSRREEDGAMRTMRLAATAAMLVSAALVAFSMPACKSHKNKGDSKNVEDDRSPVEHELAALREHLDEANRRADEAEARAAADRQRAEEAERALAQSRESMEVSARQLEEERDKARQRFADAERQLSESKRKTDEAAAMRAERDRAMAAAKDAEARNRAEAEHARAAEREARAVAERNAQAAQRNAQAAERNAQAANSRGQQRIAALEQQLAQARSAPATDAPRVQRLQNALNDSQKREQATRAELARTTAALRRLEAQSRQAARAGQGGGSSCRCCDCGSCDDDEEDEACEDEDEGCEDDEATEHEERERERDDAARRKKLIALESENAALREAAAIAVAEVTRLERRAEGEAAMRDGSAAMEAVERAKLESTLATVERDLRDQLDRETAVRTLVESRLADEQAARKVAEERLAGESDELREARESIENVNRRLEAESSALESSRTDVESLRDRLEATQVEHESLESVLDRVRADEALTRASLAEERAVLRAWEECDRAGRTLESAGVESVRAGVAARLGDVDAKWNDVSARVDDASDLVERSELLRDAALYSATIADRARAIEDLVADIGAAVTAARDAALGSIRAAGARVREDARANPAASDAAIEALDATARRAVDEALEKAEKETLGRPATPPGDQRE